MTAQMSLRKKPSVLLATTTAALLAFSGLAVAPTAALADDSGAVLTWSFNKGYSQVAPGEATGGATVTDGTVFQPSTNGNISRKIASWGEGETHTDQATGVTTAQYHGTVSMFGGGGVNGVVVTVTDPAVTVEADGDGKISATVGWKIPAQGQSPATEGQTADPVTLVNFEGDWNGNSLSGTPEWENAVAPGDYQDIGLAATAPIDGASWNPELVRALPASTRAFFYKSSTAATQADKAPSAFTADIPADLNTSVVTADSSGITVDVDASNIVIPPPTGNPAANAGAYAALIAADEVSQLGSSAAAGAAQAYIPKSLITDRSFQTTLTADPTKLDRNKEYVVVTWIAHGFLTESSFLAQAPVEITDAQWDAVYPPVATTTTVKLSSASAKYNAANTATVTVASAKGVPAGKVNLAVAGQSYSANLVAGKASIKLTKPVKVGTHAVAANFISGAVKSFKNSETKVNLKVTKATPKVSVKLSKSKLKTKSNAKVSVTVTIPGSLKATASKYKVQVFDGKKKIKTATLNSKGKVNVKLPKLKQGTHKIKVTVLKTGNTDAKSSTTKKLKVVR